MSTVAMTITTTKKAGRDQLFSETLMKKEARISRMLGRNQSDLRIVNANCCGKSRSHDHGIEEEKTAAARERPTGGTAVVKYF